MINTAIFMGRLTADPELKKTQTGISVTRFCVAVDRRFQKQGEERQADFINVQAWRGTAEFVERYFHKGSMISVRGSIRTDRYEDKDGNKRTSFYVIADEISFCGGKKESSSGSADPMNGLQEKVNDFNSNDDFEEIPVNDDLPF